MRYSTADEDSVDGNDDDDGDDDGDGDGDGDARSEVSEAPRLNWTTPRVSAISFGGFGGGPRSDGRSSMAVADLRSMPLLRPQKSNGSQRSGRSGGGGEGGGTGGASDFGMGRSGSFGNFRPRRMADYASPLPNLPLRYLRKSRRERSAAAADQGEEEEDDPAEEPPAAAVEATPQPVVETSGMAQERARSISGNSGGDASGSSMASRIPIRKKT